MFANLWRGSLAVVQTVLVGCKRGSAQGAKLLLDLGLRWQAPACHRPWWREGAISRRDSNLMGPSTWHTAQKDMGMSKNRVEINAVKIMGCRGSEVGTISHGDTHI
jgi:hypothetical protein